MVLKIQKILLKMSPTNIMTLFIVFFIGSFQLSAPISQNDNFSCPGCPVQMDPSHTDFAELAQISLISMKSDDKLKNVVKVYRQIVGGIQYDITYIAVNKEIQIEKLCQTVVLIRKWISRRPQVIFAKCNPIAQI